MHFYKYQAGGNDFVLVDNRKVKRTFSVEEIARICHRRFGVGADGVILIEDDPRADFKMVYFNSDGSQSLCGNGCRTAVDLATRLKMVKNKASFAAYDGVYTAEWTADGSVRLKMAPVHQIDQHGDDYFVDTGSPHVVRFVTGLPMFPVVEEGRRIRNSGRYAPGGTNVNFIELKADGSVAMRTYERGVEDETLSCGTGAVAAALVASKKSVSSPVKIIAPGGELKVEFTNAGGTGFDPVYLEGPVKMVFEGELDP